ncbi:LPS-assembly lipoprotein RlpB [Kingella potus]|uniref:LPS-assembly lipoprotein LptE n=1 Tax=Kingella potus TaxID=265175 RepID=A0A377R519_9NEIS|nr:LPS assembly lipoprotein LptE [Kingella potus]UOP00040.1 LPS assembly lipoprotein LptE [Kingella potus]STR03334.1 LPS-assembly lipoprotein RlpB [Kingella potus]
MNKIPAAAALLLAACGFHPKGMQPYDRLPYQQWHIQGAQLQRPLENALRSAGGTPVPAAQAQAVLKVEEAETQKDVLTITRAALVADYLLVLKVRAQAYRNGEPLGKPMEAEVRRQLEYADSEVLGKQEEEETVRREMQRDAAEQLVRRLSFLPH